MTIEISTSAPLFTVTSATTGENARWMPADVVFVTRSRPTADDCSTALRRYDAAGEWTGEITGEWRVVEHTEPFVAATFTAHATAVCALRDVKTEHKVTARLDRVREGYALVITGRAA